jgi:hypothetical protein
MDQDPAERRPGRRRPPPPARPWATRPMSCKTSWAFSSWTGERRRTRSWPPRVQEPPAKPGTHRERSRRRAIVRPPSASRSPPRPGQRFDQCRWRRNRPPPLPRSGRSSSVHALAQRLIKRHQESEGGAGPPMEDAPDPQDRPSFPRCPWLDSGITIRQPYRVATAV